MTQQGSIEVITGPMFSGKTEEGLRRCQRAVIAGQKVQVFKPTKDIRHGLGQMISNGGRRIEEYGLAVHPVKTTDPIAVSIARDTQVIMLDEAQFFSEKLTENDGESYSIVEDLMLQAHVMDRRVIITGLDMDYRAKPFGPMPFLMAIATRVTKLTAVCSCGSQYATHTKRIVDSKDYILIGGQKEYAAQCLKCYLGKS